MVEKAKFRLIVGLALVLLPGVVFGGEEITKDVYAKRRAALMAGMKEGIAVFRGSDPAQRNSDITYSPYRQNSDFLYLTGYELPEAACIIAPGAEKKFILFVKPENVISAQWFGDLPGIEGAVADFGADEAFPFEDFEKILAEKMEGCGTVFSDFADKTMQELIVSISGKMEAGRPAAFADAGAIVHAMRMIKEPGEIELIRKAVVATCRGHVEAMKAIRPGMSEREIEAIYRYVFARSGAWSFAFEPIVASGPNSTVYHCEPSERPVQAGELVMIDMGAEYENYASDVTRVYPVSGKFTPDQRRMYEIALGMEDLVIAAMKPGAKVADVVKEAEAYAREELFKLGLITDKGSAWQHLLYYFPYIGHGVGLDVHDAGDYDYAKTVLKPGMVFAIEPMIYIGDNLVGSFRKVAMKHFKVPEKEVDDFLAATKPAFDKYKGIAGRIEDDILITETGNEVLSIGLIKKPADIEAMMAVRSRLEEAL